jgi:hypothetical protein
MPSATGGGGDLDLHEPCRLKAFAVLGERQSPRDATDVVAALRALGGGEGRAIANWNPFSATVQACRQLFGNLPAGYPVPDAWPMQHPVWASLLWSVLIVVVFRTLAVRKYRRADA